MNRNEFVSALNSKSINPSEIMTKFLADKYPNMEATKINELVKLVYNRPIAFQAVINKCTDYFEEKFGVYRIFNKNKQFVKFV